MSEQVQLVDILQTEDWNKYELQNRNSIETNALNDKLVEIRNASKKRDKAFLALTIMLLICFSFAVTVIIIYLEEYIEKSSELEKQIQQLNSSGLERQSHLSNQFGTFSNDYGTFPKGEKGSRGESGSVGHKGTAGDRGQQGKKGETGEKGSAGSMGQLGDVGPKGGKGQNGTRGSQGENGMIGEKGLLGEKGAVGAKGSAGNKGTIGDKGPSGQKGRVGEKGVLGAKGQNGSKGVDGETGMPGEMGKTGLVGPSGMKGSIGEKGPTGDKGQKGEIGIAGLKGENGERGIRGDKGLMGNMGPVGNKGQIGRTITCGSGWVQFMRSCYYFQFKSKMTWNAAKTDCHRKGGFLVKIDNTVESWFLKSFIIIDKNPGHVWIGAHDSVQESRFIWESDNTVLTYTDWNTGEPNNAGQEDCAHMNSGAKYKWNDIQCSHKFSFICEKH
ncbi:pulmonary surfactant-associated protein D-like isoform X2 [Mytilus trossulus]|uniref:pulmonary surfactant-associated protein D-like isoform X2 n=1 Tax=Mytilus trossulus TaxID=6551 RepID=UPI003003F06F